MYLTLTALIQLNLIATRNPSFWWRFSKKTAPRYSRFRVEGSSAHKDLSHLLAAVGASEAAWHVAVCASAAVAQHPAPLVTVI